MMTLSKIVNNLVRCFGIYLTTTLINIVLIHI